MSTKERLLRAVQARVSAAEAPWLDQAMHDASHGSQNQLLVVYTGASQHLGRAPLALSDGGPDVVDHWTVEDGGRLLFLLVRHEASPSPAAFIDAASSCYQQGDAREQQSWLRAVAFLPDPARFLPLVVDACRTNILPLFESVACENPYPARHFPERNFNQMVLKALFTGVALARILGLPERANPELARMASDYADERRAAGRSIPVDIALAMADRARTRTDT